MIKKSNIRIEEVISAVSKWSEKAKEFDIDKMFILLPNHKEVNGEITKEEFVIKLFCRFSTGAQITNLRHQRASKKTTAPFAYCLLKTAYSLLTHFPTLNFLQFLAVLAWRTTKVFLKYSTEMFYIIKSYIVGNFRDGFFSVGK